LIPTGISISCPQPRQEAVGIIFPPDSGQAQQSLDPPSVESDHGFAINDGHRRGPVPERLKLGQRSGIFSDVLLSERDALVRKKLFL
jgi:hypothetical protein